jgi:hypothetical protein
MKRRHFLSIGGFSLGSYAISLPTLLRADTIKGKHKNLINIFLAGGPPHLDLWDLKPDAPSEIRGLFKPISTNINGIQICEVFENLSKKMDKCSIIRSIVNSHGDHAAFQCMTGWKPDNLKNIGGRPSIGSVITKLQGSNDPSIPGYIGLAEPTQHLPWSDSGNGGFLGQTFNPFKPSGDSIKDMTLHIDPKRLYDRKNLLLQLDSMKQNMDFNLRFNSYNKYVEKSFEILTDNKLLQALDLSGVDKDLLDQYGDGKPYKFQYDGAPTNNSQLLMAKRLLQAGARVVSLSYGRWDSHASNFELVKDHGSKLDQCLTALIDDLESSDMLDNTLVIVWGEFGRTPKINKDAGRDHWPQVNSALLFGGGLKHGQVIGSTNRLGEYALDRPVDFQEIIATIYHTLGVDTSSTTIVDTTGRPQYLVDHPYMKEFI